MHDNSMTNKDNPKLLFTHPDSYPYNTQVYYQTDIPIIYAFSVTSKWVNYPKMHPH